MVVCNFKVDNKIEGVPRRRPLQGGFLEKTGTGRAGQWDSGGWARLAGMGAGPCGAVPPGDTSLGVGAGGPVPAEPGAQRAGHCCPDQRRCGLWVPQGHFIPPVLLALVSSQEETALLFTWWRSAVGGVHADPRGKRELLAL